MPPALAVAEGPLPEIKPRDVKNIPGFYYDPEKQKYFKLLPGNKLPPNFVLPTPKVTAHRTQSRTPLDLQVALKLRSLERLSKPCSSCSFQVVAKSLICQNSIALFPDGAICNSLSATQLFDETLFCAAVWKRNCVVSTSFQKARGKEFVALLPIFSSIGKDDIQTVRVSSNAQFCLVSHLGGAESGWIGLYNFSSGFLSRILLPSCTVWDIEWIHAPDQCIAASSDGPVLVDLSHANVVNSSTSRR